MNRNELEHIIRAAGAIVESDELVIIGSQALLASYPDPPKELVSSMEVDLYPIPDVAKADLIDGSIGEASMFHETFGYYAHGVSPETATLPQRWKDRLVAIRNENTRGVTGLCLHPLDIAVSKLAAGREKDIAYVRSLVRHGLIAEEDLRQVMAEELPEDTARQLGSLLEMS